MENFNSFEDLIKNDQLPFNADSGIEQRLMYQFRLKSASSKIKKNQLFPFVDRLFSSRFVGLKIACTLFAVAIVIGFKQFNSPEKTNFQADTASVLHFHDTLRLIPSSDSISVN